MRSVCCGHVHQADAGGYCADCPDAGAIELGANPYQVVRNFEAALCRYTGAPYAVTTNSCTMALEIALLWQAMSEKSGWQMVNIPCLTYKSVADAVCRAGFSVSFRKEMWSGAYQLDPFPIWDSARRFTSGMYLPGRFVCCSFHASKTLGSTQGGAILHDSPEADAYFRRARFDGRAEGVPPLDDTFDIPPQFVRHAYMSVDTAATLLLHLHSLPRHNPDLPNDPYKDLSTVTVLK